jgi:peroxiredoxin Q/BCP
LIAAGAALVGCSAVQRPDGGEGPLPEGMLAPDVSGTDHTGASVRLADYRGKKQVLVYFYPKDATPGCTTEACAFRDAWRKFHAQGLEILGVSADSVESHQRFVAKHRLPFSLISDQDGEWARAFGVGSFFGMYSRVSFLIDRSGRVQRVYRSVDPAQHAEQVLADARKTH